MSQRSDMTEVVPDDAGGWTVEAWSLGTTVPEAEPAEAAAYQAGSEPPADMILATVTEMLRCAEPDEAVRLLVNRLQRFLGCRQVAWGLCRPCRKGCRVQGLSGVAQFDAHSRFLGAIQDAMEEALVHESQTQWPRDGTRQSGTTSAHERLVSLLGAKCAMSIPLRKADGRIAGVLLLVDEPGEGAFAQIHRYLPPLIACLENMLLQRRGLISRMARQVRTQLATWRGRVLCLAVIGAVLLLAIPWPYQVTCHCRVQPVVRRFVVAPYDGTLDKSLVSPGDVVQAGDILARLDEREIRWELSSLDAELARARKQRDAAMASHRTSAAQIAELDIERLEVQSQLLQHRIDNLSIRSPIDGIVVAGDLEKAEGAPLTIGQTLFEVAPLGRMTVEIHVPEEDISYVTEGMPVSVSLDAFSDEAIFGTLSRIEPQAELMEQENVFVAQFELDNPNGRLRPGMNGWAEIAGPRKRLGWILFHKPWLSLRRTLAW